MCAEYNTKLERMWALIERLTEADVAYFKMMSRSCQTGNTTS